MFADIMDNFSSVCELLEIQPGHYTHFYQELKVNNRLDIRQHGETHWIRGIELMKVCKCILPME